MLPVFRAFQNLGICWKLKFKEINCECLHFNSPDFCVSCGFIYKSTDLLLINVLPDVSYFWYFLISVRIILSTSAANFCGTYCRYFVKTIDDEWLIMGGLYRQLSFGVPRFANHPYPVLNHLPLNLILPLWMEVKHIEISYECCSRLTCTNNFLEIRKSFGHDSTTELKRFVTQLWIRAWHLTLNIIVMCRAYQPIMQTHFLICIIKFLQ